MKKADPFFILSTGTELTTGRSTDTNGPFLSRSLAAAGFSVAGLAILPDNPELLVAEIGRYMRLPGIGGVIMTGGLGPTADDHTVDVLSKVTNRGTVEDEDALRRLATLAKRRPDRLSLDSARKQVRIVADAIALKNGRGLAPGMVLHHEGRLLAAMPGVPQEMKPMFANALLPEMLRVFTPGRKHRRTFYVYGLGESQFESRFLKLDGFSQKPADFDWGVSTAEGRIHVFLESEDREAVDRLYDQARKEFGERFLEHAVELLLHGFCIEQGLRLGVAESCTGGLIGKTLTDQPGSSAYFTGSLTTYSNEAKTAVLGVEEELLGQHGAVSEQCARAMAQGALRMLKTDWGPQLP